MDKNISKDRYTPLTPSQQQTVDEWVKAMPYAQRPVDLLADFPHVILQVAVYWHQRDKLLNYLSDLLVDRRGARQGFPPDVALEILTLDDYCRTRTDW